MPILLIPGFMLTSDLWRDVEQALQTFGPIHHADMSQGATIAEIAAGVLADAPPSFVLIGFSMGGYVAREIVRLAPGRVRVLILIATSARGDSEVQARRKAMFARNIGAIAFRGLSRSAVASSLHPDNEGDLHLITRIQAMGNRLGEEIFRRQSLLVRKDERDGLGSIQCPTLIIAGEKDRLRSRREAEELHEGIASSRLEVVEGTGHMVPLEAPQELAGLLVRWLKGQVPVSV
ncbi:alpha/beta fold hydrolase [Limoniibacter endophyticus]|uniref:Alpha/beta hydrolase n=1 Tax=Limoniibacter endophyticus TaxID=1565040 RepID=A0A8J3DMT4_9HYPH|nr:alpha/beta hydrolase [Limoniibacter endophyticus]GHC71628.1 alpha/beta hydrolase [Limoniibacter endophyticus]